MKKKVIRLTESDIENLVRKIIKEENGEFEWTENTWSDDIESKAIEYLTNAIKEYKPTNVIKDVEVEFDWSTMETEDDMTCIDFTATFLIGSSRRTYDSCYSMCYYSDIDEFDMDCVDEESRIDYERKRY